jgi:hypothetical protein
MNLLENYGRTTKFYCRSDKTWHYKSELPKTLRPFVNYVFSSGVYTGNDFEDFNKKFKNTIKKMLPDNYKLHYWNKGHYYCFAVIKDDKGRFIYMSIPDVRHFPHEWIYDILIRTMEHDKDWKGGSNHRTDLINFTKDIQKLYGGK